MNKKQVLILAGLGIGSLIVLRQLMKKNNLSEEEVRKINDYKEYLEKNDYVVVNKKSYKNKDSKWLSLYSIPSYYSMAKKIYTLLS